MKPTNWNGHKVSVPSSSGLPSFMEEGDVTFEEFEVSVPSSSGLPSFIFGGMNGNEGILRLCPLFIGASFLHLSQRGARKKDKAVSLSPLHRGFLPSEFLEVRDEGDKSLCPLFIGASFLHNRRGYDGVDLCCLCPLFIGASFLP